MAPPELMSLRQWAKDRHIDEGNARRYADDDRIPGARRYGRDWLVPQGAPLLPTPQTTVEPMPPLTPGQRRVRELVGEYLPRWVAQGRPDYSVHGTFSPWLNELRARLGADERVSADEVTGHHLDHPSVSGAYLLALLNEAEYKGKVRHERDHDLDMVVSRVLDVGGRGPHKDALLGDKYASTLGVMLSQLERLQQGQPPQLTRSQYSVTVYPRSGVVWVTSGGAHRTLAALLLGLTHLRLAHVTIVDLPLNAELNDAAVRVETFAPSVWLEFGVQEYPSLLRLAEKLRVEAGTRAALLADLVASYLDHFQEQRPAQTPSQLLGYFDDLEAYLALLHRQKILTWVRGTAKLAWVDEWLLPQGQNPISWWYRHQLVRQHERED